jgi:hypothetical protein
MGTELGLGVGRVEVERASATARDGGMDPSFLAVTLRRMAGATRRAAGSAARGLRSARPAGQRTGTAARGA